MTGTIATGLYITVTGKFTHVEARPMQEQALAGVPSTWTHLDHGCNNSHPAQRSQHRLNHHMIPHSQQLSNNLLPTRDSEQQTVPSKVVISDPSWPQRLRVELFRLEEFLRCFKLISICRFQFNHVMVSGSNFVRFNRAGCDLTRQKTPTMKSW